ncbi:MAG: hypothetical protein M1820_001417 [Bogoriella megaspora]|nr:MAG: hypothetical protein M1820_001417 [Bogoriella megaspora]
MNTEKEKVLGEECIVCGAKSVRNPFFCGRTPGHLGRWLRENGLEDSFQRWRPDSSDGNAFAWTSRLAGNIFHGKILKEIELNQGRNSDEYIRMRELINSRAEERSHDREKEQKFGEDLYEATSGHIPSKEMAQDLRETALERLQPLVAKQYLISLQQPRPTTAPQPATQTKSIESYMDDFNRATFGGGVREAMGPPAMQTSTTPVQPQHRPAPGTGATGFQGSQSTMQQQHPYSMQQHQYPMQSGSGSGGYGARGEALVPVQQQQQPYSMQQHQYPMQSGSGSGGYGARGEALVPVQQQQQPYSMQQHQYPMQSGSGSGGYGARGEASVPVQQQDPYPMQFGGTAGEKRGRESSRESSESLRPAPKKPLAAILPAGSSSGRGFMNLEQLDRSLPEYSTPAFTAPISFPAQPQRPPNYGSSVNPQMTAALQRLYDKLNQLKKEEEERHKDWKGSFKRVHGKKAKTEPSVIIANKREQKRQDDAQAAIEAVERDIKAYERRFGSSTSSGAQTFPPRQDPYQSVAPRPTQATFQAASRPNPSSFGYQLANDDPQHPYNMGRPVEAPAALGEGRFDLAGYDWGLPSVNLPGDISTGFIGGASASQASGTGQPGQAIQTGQSIQQGVPMNPYNVPQSRPPIPSTEDQPPSGPASGVGAGRGGGTSGGSRGRGKQSKGSKGGKK